MRIIDYISSMTTGLILLALIGAASAVGSSILPDTFFQLLPFRFLLLLLFINMAFCTFGRLKNFTFRNRRGGVNWKVFTRNSSLVMLHVGIILILIGASFYSYLGQSAQLSILEGDTADLRKVINTDKPISLKLESFTIQYNDDGSPSQYYSVLQVIEAERPPFRKTISVNYPLKYEGIKAYQSSYGYLTQVQVDDGAAKKSSLAKDGDSIQFAATSRIVKIFKYIPYFDESQGLESSSDQPLNPRVIYSVYEGTELLGVGAAPFDEKIRIDENAFISFGGVKPFSVLLIKSDPGLPLAAAGGLLLMLGVCLSLLGPRRKGNKKPSVIITNP